MPKKTNTTKVLLGVGAAAFLAYTLTSRTARAGGRIPGKLSNFEVIDTAFDLKFYLDQVGDLAKSGRQGFPVVFLSGMSQENAKSLARKNEFVHFVWTTPAIAEEALELASVAGAPWVMAIAIPIQGAGTGVAIGDPMLGTFAEHLPHLEQAIRYAETGDA